MNPSQCSVILVKNNATPQDDVVALLTSVYSKVVVASNEDDAWRLLYQHQKLHLTTLIIYDMDTSNSNDDSDDRKINTVQQRLPAREQCFKFLRTIMKQLKDGTIHDTVPIVCSCSDSPELMIDCLHNGAADFLVKPMHAQQIKTLFLNVYRHRISRSQIGIIDPVYRLIQHHRQNPSTTVAVNDDPGNSKLSPQNCHHYSHHNQRSSALSQPQQQHGKMWNHFKGKLKSVYYTENWLARTVYNYYAPEPSMLESPQSPLSRGKSASLRHMICSWDFLPVDLTGNDLVQMVCLIFRQVLSHPELADLNVVSDDDLRTFMFDICNSYHKSNPYHNFRHAVDVVQSMYYFLCKLGVLQPMTDMSSSPQSNDNTTQPPYSPPVAAPGSGGAAATAELQSLLRPIDVLALLMACLGHDVGHPGVTNMFMIKCCTPLALLYNDRSVLESFHSMAFFHLLRNSCFHQLTEAQDWPDYARFRKIIVSSILATDMGMHDEYVLRIEQQAEAWRKHEIDLEDDTVRDEQRLILCGALIKCADISNCARPFPVSKRWAEILSEEFVLQGDLEKELGLASLPINVRGKVSLEQFQLGFKRNVAMKLYQATAQLLPAMQFCVDNIDTNISIWEDREIQFNHDSGVAEQESRDDEYYDKGNDGGDHVDMRDSMAKEAVNIDPYIVSSQDNDELMLDTMDYHRKTPQGGIDTSTQQRQWSSDSDDDDDHQHPNHHQGKPSISCRCSVQ